jgi:hypothetical protein
LIIFLWKYKIYYYIKFNLIISMKFIIIHVKNSVLKNEFFS